MQNNMVYAETAFCCLCPTFIQHDAVIAGPVDDTLHMFAVFLEFFNHY